MAMSTSHFRELEFQYQVYGNEGVLPTSENWSLRIRCMAMKEYFTLPRTGVSASDVWQWRSTSHFRELESQHQVYGNEGVLPTSENWSLSIRCMAMKEYFTLPRTGVSASDVWQWRSTSHFRELESQHQVYGNEGVLPTSENWSLRIRCMAMKEYFTLPRTGVSASDVWQWRSTSHFRELESQYQMFCVILRLLCYWWRGSSSGALKIVK